MTDILLDKIKDRYELSVIDTGDFATLKANGMTFAIEAYYAKGLGHVSVMRAKGFFGLMKMDTLIVNPTELDLPLYSYDRILAMGNDTLIVELYDTLLGDSALDAMSSVKDNYSHLPERDPGEHWYDDIKLDVSISKKGKRAHTPFFDAMTAEHFDAYLATGAATVEDKGAKIAKASTYVDGLLERGGPSTDVFKKALGAQRTERLFKNVLFGTV